MRPELITQRQWIKYNIYLTLQHFLGVKKSSKFLNRKKERLYKDILKNPGIENRGKTFYNKDVECSDFNYFFENREELMKGPILFKGLTKDWDCTKKWSKEYFRTFFSEMNVSLVGNVGLVDKENESKYTEASLGDFIDSIGKDKRNYLRFSRIIDTNPKLRSDIDVKFLERFKSKLSRGGFLYLFMGEADSKTDMHNAIIQTLFFQVKGKKKWTIYAPNERIFIDPIADRRPYFYSHVNPHNENDPNYPILKYAKKYEIIIEDGDLLWFPTFYWHYVENLTHSIGVTYKFTDFDQAFKQSKTLTSLFLLATKPTLLASFYYNTFKKRDLLFDNI